MPKEDIDFIIRGPATTVFTDRERRIQRVVHRSRVLFVAAKMGNTRFIIELIRLYPDLIWKQDDKKKTIFHLAVKRRQVEIYKLLHEIGAMKDLITPMKDIYGNNMLHMVAKSVKQQRIQNVSGVAFQMQSELLWFQEVGKMIPPNYRQRKNNEGKTPQDLFTKMHEKLLKDGGNWMKHTASQCMVVATLIATIVFAAAFTLPGGYDQDTGIPFFRSEASLIIFVISDAISLICSTTSVLMFLSILTSRYAEHDFLEALPRKLVNGITTLFLSIVTMMIAFSASFFVFAPCIQQMATTDGRSTVIEKCHVSPPSNTVGERSLPLTFFDIIWLIFHPVHQLFFFDFPHPKSHFIETVIPKLKHSLSITLQHFFPFVGNLIVSPNSNSKPEIRHVEGDSLALTFAQSDLDFNDLKQNHPRDCNKFHNLVPLLEPPFKASGLVKIPLFSIQVTVFPNSGLTIGLTNHHSLCDARTRHDFLMAWTSIAKHGSDEVFLATRSLPFYDRVIEYPKLLDDMLLSLPPIQTLDESYRVPQLEPQMDRVRSTIVLTRSQINRLKKWLLAQLPHLEYVSSFAVGCGYVWSCVAKSRVFVEGTKGEYEVEQFGCVVDWRARLSPPVPLTYFGNCTGLCLAKTKTKLITGSKGFPTAVEVLAMAIRNAVSSKQVFKDAEKWLDELLQPVPLMGVAGTPKLNVYDVDFGWGKPQKYETISLDYSDSISVNASKDSSEDLEIGLCLTAKQMDAFVTISRRELEST